MKTNKFLFCSLAFFLIVTFVANASGKQDPEKIEAKMPANVKSIIERSCFGCHNTDSKNEDAKEELDFKTFHELRTFKKIGTLKDIEEVIEEEEMPPKKFLEKFPDKKLSDEEREILTTWVKQEAENLIENQ